MTILNVSDLSQMSTNCFSLKRNIWRASNPTPEYPSGEHQQSLKQQGAVKNNAGQLKTNSFLFTACIDEHERDTEEVGPLGNGYKQYSKRGEADAPEGHPVGPLGNGYQQYSKRGEAKEPEGHPVGPLGNGYMQYSKRAEDKQVSGARGSLGNGYQQYS
ncbi:hypothetical protein A9Z42_0068660 [Trichoderma parareesei]|uniref:Uncharacterized protein n=1 Tax=Trichoderma parareesei TaxID=858221 RepID=A0A2H3A234_TRIPA|nr:hypothetical protein A9Z42_0068660 [Trichoderma parareesei]